MRSIESLFEARTIAIVLLFGCCVTLALYRGSARELEVCRNWSAKACKALPQSKQDELRADWELERDLAEALADELGRRD